MMDQGLGSAGGWITAGIAGVVVVIVAFAIYPRLQSATDTYYLEFVERCEIGSESFVRVYQAGTDRGAVTGSPAAVTNSSGTCAAAALSEGSVGDEVRSEHGVKVGVQAASNAVTLTTGHKWVLVEEVLDVYAGLSTLILSILPVLAVTGFLGVSAHSLYFLTQGTMGLQGVIVRSIAGLIVTIAGLYLGPTILDFLVNVYEASDGSRYSIMERFSGIIQLVLGFFPVVYTAGLLSVFAWQGVGIGRGVRGGSRQGGYSPGYGMA